MGKREEILELANRELQEKGVGSLSFRELAAKLGIKSSSVHYYFPQKDDLIEAVARDYAANMLKILPERTDKLAAGKPRLMALLDLIHEYIENRFCTAGILAVESAHISDAAKTTVANFFSDLQNWIQQQLKAMDKDSKEVQTLGAVILTSIEGCLMLDSLGAKSGYLEQLRNFIKIL